MAEFQEPDNKLAQQSTTRDPGLADEQVVAGNTFSPAEGVSISEGKVSFQDSFHYAVRSEFSNCCEQRLKEYLLDNPQLGVRDIEADTVRESSRFFIGRVRKTDRFDKTDSITIALDEEPIDPHQTTLLIKATEGVEQLRDNLYLIRGSAGESVHERFAKFQEANDFSVVKTIPIDQLTQQRHRTRAMLVLTDPKER